MRGEKALSFGEKDKQRQVLANTLFENHKNEVMDNKYTIKGSQYCKPKFEFSGACAGCGEAAYLKLLTQLFGDNLIIANATGCSSIYGGSVPSFPYSIPWANSLFEDNAEFGFGIFNGYKTIRNNISNVMDKYKSEVSEDVKELFDKYQNNIDDYEVSKEVYDSLKTQELPKELEDLKQYINKPSVWAVGGDGWSYDIGFSGIDHVLSSNENINILILDTEVYSNTGGQASKSSHYGQVAQFAAMGKRTNKKDMFRIAMSYSNVYVGSISLGANMFQTIKTLKEAYEHNGPSIVIAYSPCIEQGIKKGMSCAATEQKLAVECGYNILMRYNGEELFIDSKEPDFEKYHEFLNGEVRYNSLVLKNPELAKELLEVNKDYAKKRYNYYKNLLDNQKKED
jgi:pyruvate-ferredoxin/flavodoxin oxidoreductase